MENCGLIKLIDVAADIECLAYLDKWDNKMHAFTINLLFNSLESIEDNSSFTSINDEDESAEEDSSSKESCADVANSREEFFH